MEERITPEQGIGTTTSTGTYWYYTAEEQARRDFDGSSEYTFRTRGRRRPSIIFEEADTNLGAFRQAEAIVQESMEAAAAPYIVGTSGADGLSGTTTERPIPSGQGLMGQITSDGVQTSYSSLTYETLERTIHDVFSNAMRAEHDRFWDTSRFYYSSTATGIHFTHPVVHGPGASQNKRKPSILLTLKLV